MVKSMTGYGRGEYTENGRRFLAELKTVNHKYSDVYVKLPRQLAYLEDKIVDAVKNKVTRGKTEVFITYEFYGEDSKQVILDKALAKAYIDSCRLLSDEYGIENDATVSLISRFPDVMRVEQEQEDEDLIWRLMENALSYAIKNLIEMRALEGQKLAADVQHKLQSLNALSERISVRAPDVVTEYREKLAAKIKELQGQKMLDENRLATEVLYFAERSDINEELVRLRSHILQMEDCFKANEPVGKKLDFLVQEMNREVNTIGSKANDLIITREVVEAKTLIDKIREQIQNIE